MPFCPIQHQYPRSKALFTHRETPPRTFLTIRFLTASTEGTSTKMFKRNLDNRPPSTFQKLVHGTELPSLAGSHRFECAPMIARHRPVRPCLVCMTGLESRTPNRQDLFWCRHVHNIPSMFLLSTVVLLELFAQLR